MDPDIITASDPTTFQALSPKGQGNRTMFDRRANAFVQFQAYLFDATLSDGLSAEIQVNPEFGSSEAARVEAEKYAIVIGRIPKALRIDVLTVWIHKGMEDGIFPHARTLDDPKEIEEERRLAYVGLTRAEKRLYISRAEYRLTFGTPKYNPASRFLDEIPAELIEWNNESPSSLASSSGVKKSRVPSGPPPRATGKKSTAMALVVGQRVSHDTFGLGTVVALAGEGDKSEATINFGAYGDKRLLLRYAPVTAL
jgi:hypothetical protein